MGPLATTDDDIAAELLGLTKDQLLTLGLATHDDGAAKGVATWERRGDLPPHMGAIALPPGATLQDLFGVARNVARAMLATGHKSGTFTVDDPQIARAIARTFRVTAEPAGHTPITPEEETAGKERTPMSWLYEVDLQDAIDQVTKELGA